MKLPGNGVSVTDADVITNNLLARWRTTGDRAGFSSAANVNDMFDSVGIAIRDLERLVRSVATE